MGFFDFAGIGGSGGGFSLDMGSLFGKDGGGGAMQGGYAHLGNAPWLWRQYARQRPDFQRMEDISREIGQLQLNLPEFNVARGDYFTRLMQGTGARQADIASQAVSSALAGRGGGGLSSAVSLGTQARTGANLESISKGAGLDFQAFQADMAKYMAEAGAAQQQFGAELGVLQAERQALQNALAARFNTLNQIVGAYLGQLGAGVQMEVASTHADAITEAAQWKATGDVLGSYLGKP
jgi:hypothetical protein